MIRYIALAAAAATIIGIAATAWASCPPFTTYQCTQGMNGKVICGCR